MEDQPTSVRPHEVIDQAMLEQYLRQHLAGFDRLHEIRQFPGGFSNLTYLLRTNLGELVLRRPPFGAAIRSAHDMGREYRVLCLLRPHYERVPRPLHYCEDAAIIGAPFYLMERVRGLILRNRPPREVDLSPERMAGISRAAIDQLAILHGLDLEASGLASLGRPEHYIERQINGWTQRYRQAQTDAIPEMDDLADWLARNRPADASAGLIHNDYKYDNLVLDPEQPTEIRAVLDWEMATVGDTRMDLGTTLAYWAEAGEAEHFPLAAANLTWLPGNLSRSEVVEHYVERSGTDLPAPLFFFVYGTFKVAVIVQQIYSRWRQGHTQDPRFATLLELVHYLSGLGARAIELDRISRLR